MKIIKVSCLKNDNEIPKINNATAKEEYSLMINLVIFFILIAAITAPPRTTPIEYKL